MIMEKINELMADAEFIKGLLASKDEKEAIELLNKEGAECSYEEGVGVLLGLKDYIDKSTADQEAMDLDSMDAVAGGGTLFGDMARTIVETGFQTYGMVKANRYAGIQMIVNVAGNMANVIADISTGNVPKQAEEAPEQAAPADGTAAQ